MKSRGMRGRKATAAIQATARARQPAAKRAAGDREAAPAAPQAPQRHVPRDIAPTATSSDALVRTYSGLLDDAMLRYSDDYVGEAFFNKMIVKNLMFGGGIYLNDGYLVNHPVARKYLADEHSLLRVMILTGFIRILTRERDPVALYDMPERMARSGNASFGKLVASSEWAQLRPTYKAVAENLFHIGNARSWPGFDMSFGFAKLVEGIFGREPRNLGLRLVTEDQLKRIEDAFRELRPREGNARHKFEVAVDRIVQGQRGPMAEMMTIGNQAYHYNFGLTLTEEDVQGVAVDTTIGMAFDELLATREIRRGQLDDFPLIQVPDGLPFEQGDLFRPFLDGSGTIGGLKRQYLAALRMRLAEGAESGDAAMRAHLHEVTQAYLDAIIEWFSPKTGRSAAEAMFSNAIVVAMGNVSAPPGIDDEVVASVAPTAGLAIALQAQGTALKREFLIERFRLVDADADFNPSRERFVTLGDIRPQIASLAFNPDRAKAFISDIPAIKTP